MAPRVPHLGQFLSKTFSLPYQRMMHGRQPTMDLQQLLAMIGGVGGLSLHITHSNAWLMATARARGSSIDPLVDRYQFGNVWSEILDVSLKYCQISGLVL